MQSQHPHKLKQFPLMELAEMVWEKIEMKGEVPPGRALHSVTQVSDTEILLYVKV